MRADRLISLLMLLQNNGRMSARQLAQKLEVSERTVYRDVEALSASGVPIYAETGREGGYALLDSYRTSLTGLNESEVQALFMLSIPEPLAHLGIRQDLRQALLKLTASLPDRQRAYEDQVRQRFYLDSVWWDQDEDPTPYLRSVYDAVWNNRRLLLVYFPIPQVSLEARVDPLGLVAKAGVWYLVATRAGQPARVDVFRVSELVRAELLDESSSRPPGFDLEQFWRDWCARHAQGRSGYPVQVRVSPQFLPVMPWVFGDSIRAKIAQAAPPDEQGWTRLELCFDSIHSARGRLLACGRGVEVLSPWALRRSILDYAEQITQQYMPGEDSP